MSKRNKLNINLKRMIKRKKTQRKRIKRKMTTPKMKRKKILMEKK
jgi:hypothetical protein